MSSVVVPAVVVGGGVSGLVAARDLVKAGVEPVVLEAGDIAGGKARTTTEDTGFAWEWGPHTITSTAHAVHDLVDELGLTAELVPTQGSSSRFIYRNGVMHRMPTNPLAMLTSGLLSKRGWARIFAEPFLRGRTVPGETVTDFFSRRIGAEAAKILVGSFVSGIYAGDASRLGVADAFPTLAAFEASHGSIARGALAARRAKRGEPKREKRGIRGFAHGTGALPTALADVLGDRVHTGRPVDKITRWRGQWRIASGDDAWRTDRLVIATPPPATASLLDELSPTIAGHARATPMAPVAVVHVMGHGDTPPDGFGCLIPRGEGIESLGILFVSSQVPTRAPAGGWLLTAFLGGATNPSLPDADDETLIAIARGDIRRVTGFSGAGDQVRVIRHRAAIPQLTPGHLARMDEVRVALKSLPGLALGGNWMRGVSLDHAVRAGHEAAAAVAAFVPNAQESAA